MDFFHKLRKQSSSDASSKRHSSTTSSQEAQTPRAQQQSQFVFPTQTKHHQSTREVPVKAPIQISAPLVTNLTHLSSQKVPLQDSKSHVSSFKSHQSHEKHTLEPYRQQKVIESISKETFQRPVFSAQPPPSASTTSVNNNNTNVNTKNAKKQVLSEKKSAGDEPIFDPEPAKEEGDTFSHTIFLDDRSFMVDDDELDKEVSSIISNKSNNKSLDSISIVNEVPEGRLSKHSTRSSRASSSMGSASLSESYANRLADFTSEIGTINMTMASDYSEHDASKNHELMNNLMKKLNLKSDSNHTNYSSDSSKKNSLTKTPLQKKIQRNQFEKQNSEGSSVGSSNASRLVLQQAQSIIKVTSLPQTFICKYLGKCQAKGLWGVTYTREPIDRLVNAAKRLKSLDELPTMDVLISEKGLYVVQNANNSKKSIRNFRSGLIPISNISYGVQDNKFGKIFSCIVVRERESKTLVECYAFLNSKIQISKKMALSLTLAFKEYGKLLQLKDSNTRRMINLNDSSNNDSVA